MKIAVTGKGGVGKTTLSAMLAAVLNLNGQDVIAIDADPDANLASALGLPPEDQPAFLAEMKDFIAERTGSQKEYGGYFKLNPRVDDIPDKYSVRVGNIRLLALGGVRGGGTGCICPATALIKALLTHVTLGSNDALIMDMEAGIEHLGRATTQSMDALLLVVDEGPWSIHTALRVRQLAKDIGLEKVAAVVNRVTDKTDLAAIGISLEGIPIVGSVPFDQRLPDGIFLRDQRQGVEPTALLSQLRPRIMTILERLEHL